ncbi:hypothetical protein, variant [Sphaeroforma arctica JP610]|uniref:C2 domain-containing protein n=1 Tax=Sphaeroforma arctica JP610 TaxID=667725 RepID=A0A0L0FZF6_9EUKA|nr:hypothetical protein, variant [Sphaeroforma arctica JP610]KNC82014.1 hypothetical protein, variant [Sphaeroforma arctica JP610]|eukprot:XP_014155916.1 hypothetical protein, variant [Sphaeroforma arctica JP610]
MDPSFLDTYTRSTLVGQSGDLAPAPQSIPQPTPISANTVQEPLRSKVSDKRGFSGVSFDPALSDQSEATLDTTAFVKTPSKSQSTSQKLSSAEATALLEEKENSRKYDLLKWLIHDLYKYGSPAHSLEEFSFYLAQSFGNHETSIRLAPTGFFLITGRNTEFVNVDKSVNMDRLARVRKLAIKIIKGFADLDYAEAKIAEIQLLKELYARPLRHLCQVPYAIGFAIFFFGGDLSCIYLGIITGGFNSLVLGLQSYGYLQSIEKLTTFVCAFIAGLWCSLFVYLGWQTSGCSFSLALGSTAFFFPGVTISFSVLEMVSGLLSVGGVRYTYSLVVGHMLAVALMFAAYLIFFFQEVEGAVFDPCENAVISMHRAYRIPAYALLYPAAILCYNIPPRMYLPFFVVQFFTCLVIQVASAISEIPSALATGMGVFTMTVVSGLLCKRFMRSLLRSMDCAPVCLLVPTIELVVPGSSIVKQLIAMMVQPNSENSSPAGYIVTSMAIAMAILIGDAFLHILRVGGVFKVPIYKGPINNVHEDVLFDPDYIAMQLPEDGKGGDMFVMVMIREAQKLPEPPIEEDIWNPFVDCMQNGKTVARSSTKIETLHPVWDEAFILPMDNSGNGQEFEMRVRNYTRFGQNGNIASATVRFEWDSDKVDARVSLTSTSFGSSVHLANEGQLTDASEKDSNGVDTAEKDDTDKDRERQRRVRMYCDQELLASGTDISVDYEGWLMLSGDKTDDRAGELHVSVRLRSIKDIREQLAKESLKKRISEDNRANMYVRMTSRPYDRRMRRLSSIVTTMEGDKQQSYRLASMASHMLPERRGTITSDASLGIGQETIDEISQEHLRAWNQNTNIHMPDDTSVYSRAMSQPTHDRASNSGSNLAMPMPTEIDALPGTVSDMQQMGTAQVSTLRQTVLTANFQKQHSLPTGSVDAETEVLVDEGGMRDMMRWRRATSEDDVQALVMQHEADRRTRYPQAVLPDSGKGPAEPLSKRSSSGSGTANDEPLPIVREVSYTNLSKLRYEQELLRQQQESARMRQTGIEQEIKDLESRGHPGPEAVESSDIPRLSEGAHGVSAQPQTRAQVQTQEQGSLQRVQSSQKDSKTNGLLDVESLPPPSPVFTQRPARDTQTSYLASILQTYNRSSRGSADASMQSGTSGLIDETAHPPAQSYADGDDESKLRTHEQPRPLSQSLSQSQPQLQQQIRQRPPPLQQQYSNFITTSLRQKVMDLKRRETLNEAEAEADGNIDYHSSGSATGQSDATGSVFYRGLSGAASESRSNMGDSVVDMPVYGRRAGYAPNQGSIRELRNRRQSDARDDSRSVVRTENDVQLRGVLGRTTSMATPSSLRPYTGLPKRSTFQGKKSGKYL